MPSFLLVWRNLVQARVRTILSALAVSLGSGTIIATSIMSSGMRTYFSTTQNVMDWVLDIVDVVFSTVGIVLLAAAGFLIFNAFAMAVTQRRQQIGMLRSLGMTRQAAMRQVLWEAFFTGGLGTFLGLFVGGMLGFGLLKVMELFGVEVGRGQLSLGSVLLAFGLGIGITLLSVVFPARRAARVSPLTAMKFDSPTGETGTKPFWTVLSVLIITALGMYLILAPPGEWSGKTPPWDMILPFFLILLWLGALGMLVPALTRWFVWMVRSGFARFWGASGRFILDNLGRDPRRVTLTILTFAVGLAMIVGLNGILVFSNEVLLMEGAKGSLGQTAWLVFSFDRSSGVGQLDEMNMAISGEGGISPAVEEAVRQRAAKRAEVTEVYMVVVDKIGSPFPGFPTSISSLYSLTRPGNFTFVEGDWKTARPIMEGGCGVLLPPSVAAGNDVGVGDELVLDGLAGPVQCTVAGIGSGGTAPMSVISMAARDQFTKARPISLSVWPYAGADLKALEADLIDITETFPGQAFLSTPEDEVQGVIQTSDQLEGMTNGLLVLAILAAALGMVNTTMMSVMDRRRELGLLRGLGLTRGQLVRVVLGEAALMGMIGGLVGVLAGVGMTAIFVLGRGGIGFGLIDLDLWDAVLRSIRPIVLPGLAGVAGMAGVSLVAAWLPARNLLRASPINIMEVARSLQPEQRAAQKPSRIGLHSLAGLAWRNLTQERTRTTLSVLAIALGVAMTLAMDLIGGAVLQVFEESELARSFGQGLFDQFDQMLAFIGAAVTAAAGFLIYNAFAMSLTQRRQQIGALRSLGMSQRQVLRMVLVEGLITGGLGVLVGLVVGPIFGKSVIALLKSSNIFINAFGEAHLSNSSFVLAVSLGMGITLFSVLIPARNAARFSPLEALRAPDAQNIQRNPVRFVAIAGVIVAGLFGWLAVSPPGEWLNSPWNLVLSVGLTLVWLGCIAVSLPAVVGWIGCFAGNPLTRWLAAVGRLIADNLQRARRRVTLTITILAVGLALIVGMSGMFTFMLEELFGNTMRALQDQGGIILFTMNPYEGTSMYSKARLMPTEAKADTYAAVKNRGTIIEWHFVIVPELSFMGDTYFSFMLDPVALAKSGSTFIQFIDGSWETALPVMQAGCGLLLTPVIAQNNGVGVGDTLTVTSEKGPVDCQVAGIGATFVSASIIGIAAADAFNVGEPLGLYISPTPGTDRDILKVDLDTVVERHDLFLMEMDAYSELLDVAFDQIINIFNAMLLMTIIAAALGVVNTTVISIAERRQEMGLLRAVGGKRRELTRIVVGESALMGFIGGAIGLVAGIGFTMIFVTTYGGKTWGIENLDLWAAVWRSVRPAFQNGVTGVLAAPIVAALAAWYPARALLRGTAITTLQPERPQNFTPGQIGTRFLRWGTIRTRFLVGTGVLLLLVIAGLTSVVTNHARTRLEAQIQDTLRTIISWNGFMLEAMVSSDTENLEMDSLMPSENLGNFDADTMLQFENLMDDITGNGLVDFSITDRNNMVLLSLDRSQIGTLAPALENPKEAAVLTELQDGTRLMYASAPVRNQAEEPIGAVRMTVNAHQIDDFLIDLRNALWTIGAGLILIGLVVSGWLSAPLTRTAGQLAAHAREVGRGSYTLYQNPTQNWLSSRFSLRTKLTFTLVATAFVLVGVLQWVTVPTERRYMESTLKEGMVGGIEWAGQMISSSLDLRLPGGENLVSQFSSLESLLSSAANLDLGEMQALFEQAQLNEFAYTALLDSNGEVMVSNQIALIGKNMPIGSKTTLEEGTWRGEGVWAISTPLTKGRDGEQIGALRVAVRQGEVEAFLDDSRNLFQMAGLIAVLAAVLLAQVIGSAVAAPVTQLAAGTRQIARGDLNVRFQTGAKDELAVLADAYNQMVLGLQEREWLRDMFGRFVSREVADAIRTGKVNLEGENRVVSVLFCDIRDFTMRSENASPEKIVDLLNRYLPVVVAAAERHQGTVNKFGGDSTLVIYGAPNRLEDSAYQAVLTAFEVRRNLNVLNENLEAAGQAPIQIGIGINTGVALAAAIGPPERQEYTVIGDTVNLASRIVALDKLYPGHTILISESTYEALGHHQDEFVFEDLGKVPIRGKAHPVRVWAVQQGGENG